MLVRRIIFSHCTTCFRPLPQVLSTRKHYLSRWVSFSLTCRMATLSSFPISSIEARFKHFEDIQKIVPTFYVDGNSITPIMEPSEFYSELKRQILAAKTRIFIAALYVGASEQELIDTISLALSRSSSLQVYILIDCLRGTRVSEDKSSATLLLPLIEKYPAQVRVNMYHTPDLKGIMKKVLPQRFNEGVGLMHVKAFGFDHNLILSGANLNHDYFTNRQDRYMLFSDSPQLTNYFSELIETIGSFSYSLSPSSTKDNHLGYGLTLSTSPDPVTDSACFKSEAEGRMRIFINKWMSTSRDAKMMPSSGKDTLIMPTVQMGPLGILQDEEATLKVFELADEQGRKGNPAQWDVALTSGYFNFTKEYSQRVIETHARFRLLTAAPQANGFFRSKGVSKYIPPAYTLIEHKFYTAVVQAGRHDSVTIEEYTRPGWTYHSKGLWIYLPGDKFPSLTMIGSPNFGYRSSKRDLEAQVVIVTENETLQRSIHEELNSLRKHSEVVTEEVFERPERRVPFLVGIATYFVRTML